MKHGRVLFHLVRADFLERVRRYSFLLTLAATIYLAYSVFVGQTVLKLDQYRGVYNSAWTGSMMTLVSTAFISLVGFYIVRNAVQRDEQTRVGQVLASTPMSKAFYTLAKALSSFAVLSAMVAVLALAAVILQLLRSEHTALHLGTLLAPFIWVALPAMAITASLAILFETLPVMRGGIGNVIYFFAWSFLLAGSVQFHWDDFAGFNLIGGNMQSSLKALDPSYKGGFTLSLGGDRMASKTFQWDGVNWTLGVIAHRLLWFLVAAAVALLASAFFHRFDPAQEGRAGKRRPEPEPTGPEVQAAVQASLHKPTAGHLTPPSQTGGRTRLLHLVVTELRLMLQGHRWWWYGVVLVLFGVSLFAPAPIAEGFALAAWIWPILVWSQLGARETRYATRSLIFASERALYRQLPATWLAGVLLAILTGGGWGFRLLLTGQWSPVAAWLTGAMFVPALALALGVWSGNSKSFEAIYTTWWYIGPAHHTPGLDFMGTTPASTNIATYALLVAILLTAAYLGRRTQMGYA